MGIQGRLKEWLHLWIPWDLRPCLGLTSYFWEAQLRTTSLEGGPQGLRAMFKEKDLGRLKLGVGMGVGVSLLGARIVCGMRGEVKLQRKTWKTKPWLYHLKAVLILGKLPIPSVPWIPHYFDSMSGRSREVRDIHSVNMFWLLVWCFHKYQVNMIGKWGRGNVFNQSLRSLTYLRFCVVKVTLGKYLTLRR